MFQILKKNSSLNGGYFIMTVLIFSAIFGTLVAALFGFTTTQKKVQVVKQSEEKALQIAEAGLDYYKWFLAHYPENVTDGTGEPGPYVHSYEDPEGSTKGKFSLEIDGNCECGDVTFIEIISTGWVSSTPQYKKTVYGHYARPSVAEYSYILDDNVWAGADREIKGPYHSNKGIRMDGENQSMVTSAVETWDCTSSFGCSPTQEKPGVFGDGENNELWSYPVPQMDFDGITVDFAHIKNKAQGEGGVYLPPVGGRNSDRRGYHLIFKSDSTIDVYKVTNTDDALSKHIDDINGGWYHDYFEITNKTFVNNYDIPDSCSVVFVEDRVWLEGEISEKVTVAAADIAHGDFDPNIVLTDDVEYVASADSPGITVMAENSVLIPLHSPDNLELNGIFVAQKGYFGRNLYPCWYWPYDKRSNLEIKGSIVSSKRVGTKWDYYTWSCGSTWSGYEERENKYDKDLADAPPPFTPYTSDQYEFVEWRQDR